MPETTPISKTDTALAASVSGQLPVSAGPGAIPVLSTGMAYATNTRTLAITDGLTSHVYPTLAALGASCLSIDTTAAPPWQIGGQRLADLGPENRVYTVNAVGPNLVGANRQNDPTKTMSRLAMEWQYWNAVGLNGGPPEYTHEFHLPSVIFAGAIEIRPLSILVGDSTHKAIATFAVSSLTFADELATVDNGGFNFSSVHTQFVLNLAGHGVVSMSGSASADVSAFGRGTVPTTSTFNGTQVAVNYQLASVNTYQVAVSTTNGGDYTLFGPSGQQLDQMWTAGGINQRWTQQRIKLGGFSALAAQIQIVPDAVGTIGLVSKALASQTASTLQCQDPSGNPILTVAPTVAGGITIGASTPITKHLTATATLDFPSTAAQSSAELTISLTGAAVGDAVFLGLPAAPVANISFDAYVSAADTIKVRFNNYSSGAIDPVSGTYRVSIIK